MTRPIMALVTFMIFALGVMPVMAHEEYRVIGVITKRQDTSIQVKNKDGKTFSIALKKDVTISRDKKKVAATELKKGLTTRWATARTTWKRLTYVSCRRLPRRPRIRRTRPVQLEH